MPNALIDPQEFRALDALDRVRAINRAYGPRAMLLSSMQRTAGVMMRLIHRADAAATILFVDTQLHFPETLQTRDRSIMQYGLRIVTVAPEAAPDRQRREFGRDLHVSVEGQPICCELRKEKPFLRVARRMRVGALMAGLMQSEDGKRRTLAPVGHDPRLGCPVFHPIFDWTGSMIEDYARARGLPVHPLHARGYPSIGCAPCTTPVQPGENPRAGRWRHLRDGERNAPRYCGINSSDRGAGA